MLFNEVVGGKFSLVKAASFTLRPGERLNVAQPSTKDLSGTQIEAAADVFVDSNGRAPSGPLTVYVSTLDLRDPAGRMPGNFGAVASTGSSASASGQLWWRGRGGQRRCGKPL